jgi:hypothetical protein
LALFVTVENHLQEPILEVLLRWSAVFSGDLNAVTEFTKLSGQGFCAMDEKIRFGFDALLDVVDPLMKNLPDQAT